MAEDKNKDGLRHRQENPSASPTPPTPPLQQHSASPVPHLHEEQPPEFSATKFTIIASITAISVLLLFVLNLSYLFGSTFRSASKTHAFDIVFIDYDHGGTVSQSFLTAYEQLKGPTFPTIVIENAVQYPTTQSLIDAIKAQRYWGAVFILQGASARLEAAISPQPAAPYNASDAIAYIWDEIRYPAISSSIVQPNIIQLTSVAQAVWQRTPLAVDSLVSSIAQNATNTALKAYLNPLRATEISPWPAAQMAKVFYNTVAMAMSIVQQNMFVITLNGLATKLGLFNKFSIQTTGCILLGISMLFTLLGGLMTTSYIWAFREDWNVSGRQFMETWMLLWLVMHIYYLFLDAALATFHAAFYPVIVVTFVFLNITSTCFPLELSPGFYRWGQSLPAYAAFQVLLDIWSASSAKMYQNLPILFGWWLVCICLSAYGVFRRWQAAHRAASIG